MRTAFVAVIACLFVGGGCRQDPHLSAHIELMNAERRALEDQLYHMEYEYETAVSELKDLREDDTPSPRPSSERDAPRDTRPRQDEPLDLSPPSVEEGDLTIPQIEIPESRGRGRRENAAEFPMLAGPLVHDPEITRIKVDSRRTRGVDLDTHAGDDGLEVVIQPRNNEGEIVALPGPVTIVLLDYALQGQGTSARVARWELTAEEVGRFLRDTPAGQGIRLQLLWPNEPPEHPRLQLHVRYTTLDGRRLETQSDVVVNRVTQTSDMWTPRAPSNRSRLAQSDEDDGSAEDPADSDRAADAEDAPEPLPRPQWKPYR